MKLLMGEVPKNQWAAPRWLKKIDEDFYNKTGKSLTYLNDDNRISHGEIADELLKAYGSEL